MALGGKEDVSSQVWQQIFTVPQHRYTLRFAFATPAVATKPLQVLWDGKVVAELSVSGEAWQVYTSTVTATTQETKLEFQGEGYVDAVEVTAVE